MIRTRSHRRQFARPSLVALAALALCAALTGCGVNPVTGKQEIQFV